MTLQENLEADVFQVFSQRHGLNFVNLYLLRRALTHRSYINEHPALSEDNERLEFLGDAVLDFLSAAWLFDRFPEFDEGQMTRCRSALVGNEQLAEFARRLGLGELLLLGRGEQSGGGRIRPALLGSAFEALVGALYLDQGIEAVRRLMLPLLDSEMEAILRERKDLDSKSMLQEWAQAHGSGSPAYELLETSGPDHARIFRVAVAVAGKVCGEGLGASKQLASKAAATQALRMLGLIT